MEDTTSLTLGKRILYHRKRLGLTQDQLAERMGVTAQAVSKWENDLSCPDVTTLPKLAELFGISTDELLGVVRPEEPRKVHVGEVVDEKPREDRTYTFEIKQDGIWFAAFLLLTGVLYLVASLLQWKVSFWSLLWPAALLCLGLNACCKRFSGFGIGASLAGLYFLLVNLELIPGILSWPIVLAALLILWGISILLDHQKKARRRGWRHAEFHQDGGDGKIRRDYQNSSGYIHGDFAFCSERITVHTEELQGGKVEVAFGSLVLNLTECQSVAQDCCLDVDASFGSLVLLVPRRFRVESRMEHMGGGTDLSGQPDRETAGVIRLEGDVSFGSLKIQYV